MAKQIAAKQENQVVGFDLSLLEEDAGLGNEEIGHEDLALPFLKILSKPDLELNAKAGDIRNTVTNEVFDGAHGIKVIPCVYQRRFIHWLPRGKGTGAPIKLYSPAETRPKTERSAENVDLVVGGEGDYLQETAQQFVLVQQEDGHWTECLIAMKSTQLKKSRKWNSMIQSRVMTGKNGDFNPPRFSYIYDLKTVDESNSKGDWHGWEISLDSELNSIGVYKQAKLFAESINRGDVEVKHQPDEVVDENVPF